MNPLLRIKNLSIDFHGENGITNAVQDISFDVNRGEIVAIVGESGSGKSVTALSVLGLLPSPPAKYVSGEIFFTPGEYTIDLLKQSPGQLQQVRGNQAAMIFQEPMTSLNPVFTCGHQVMESIRLHKKLATKAAKKQTIALFEQVKLPDPVNLFNRYPHQLSGGQKQRVMIAMAMGCKPSLLICDEPTTALDVTVQKTILELIKDLQRTEKMGVIFITHDLGVVAEVADRAIVLFRGKIVEEGLVKTLLTSPKHPYTKSLLNCRPILHKKGERLPVASDFMEIDSHGEIIERKQINNPPAIVVSQDELPNPASAVDKLVEVKDLHIWFPAKRGFPGSTGSWVKAVDGISFDIFTGETLGLVGESGCGKTTLGRALLRLIKPHSGEIFFRSRELGSYGPRELKALRKDIQIIFQDPYASLNPRLTIGSAIAEPLEVHHILKNRQQRKNRVVELLEKVDLKAEHLNRYPHEFSGGQRQRIVIARALALNPSFIVCDESVSALDVSVQAQVLNLLNDLKKEFGFTTVFISHDLSVVQYVSDRILVMNKGKMEEVGDAFEICHHPKNEYTKKLLASIPTGLSV